MFFDVWIVLSSSIMIQASPFTWFTRSSPTLIPMIITGVDGDPVTLDANHLLAGKGLLVQLDLLDILDQVGSRAHATPTMKPRWKRQPR